MSGSAESSVPLLRWDGPGPYVVAFSTRLGGVSEAPFDSLNLGRLTADDAVHVTENRTRLCSAAGADADDLVFNRQVHGAIVRQADPDGRGEPADGLWTDAPHRPLLVFTADCVPVAIGRAGGPRPALALLHVGWRGLLAGIVQAGAAALGGRLHAALGPAIGPCCYEVGDEVRTAFRTQFGARILRGRHLDLWAATEHALRAAGVVRVARSDLCTACSPQLFFSHRRDDGFTGRQGALAYVA
jgi:purine-nucleoside/S-methyl-5'-thioadenosine phosphorylase / adenosine deaminase